MNAPEAGVDPTAGKDPAEAAAVPRDDATGTAPSVGGVPPEWARVPELDGIQLASFAGVLAMQNSRAAQAVWRQVPGVTDSDAELALAPFGGVLPDVAVARARALGQARRGRLARLPEDRWQRHLRRVWDDLSEEQKRDPEAVRLAVAREEAGEQAARRLMKTRRPPGRPPVERDERLRLVQKAMNDLREEEGFDKAAFDDLEEFRHEAYQLRLTRKAIADRLGRHPATLRRWGHENPKIARLLDKLP
ncbi:MAG: hypothetical protein ACP5VP_04395 [Candidatus Limnocylindrales bacterium]